MVETILNGRAKTHYYCRIPWSKHIAPFIENNIFYVKYEDMLHNPQEQSRRICKYLGIKVSNEEIKRVIENQSFESKKNISIGSMKRKNISV